jgi:hypothetical protein
VNKRIKELIEDASGDDWRGDKLNAVLLAELVVRECIRKIENEAEQYAQPTWAFELVNDLKETFGIRK